jgi:hypothetical protein
MARTRTAKCKRCRIHIMWCRTERGSSIALDFRGVSEASGDLFAVQGETAILVKEIHRPEWRARGYRLYPSHTRFCKPADRRGE